ncbi:hypothetical protein [Methanoregula sp.]|uniref:hypothetical protein n=1 Tax=Methanoregula sp. TaxID=2052170 RepID=UPI00356AA10F
MEISVFFPAKDKMFHGSIPVREAPVPDWDDTRTDTTGHHSGKPESGDVKIKGVYTYETYME